MYNLVRGDEPSCTISRWLTIIQLVFITYAGSKSHNDYEYDAYSGDEVGEDDDDDDNSVGAGVGGGVGGAVLFILFWCCLCCCICFCCSSD